jgi:hypothetical protein
VSATGPRIGFPEWIILSIAPMHGCGRDTGQRLFLTPSGYSTGGRGAEKRGMGTDLGCSTQMHTYGHRDSGVGDDDRDHVATGEEVKWDGPGWQTIGI